MRRPRRNDPPRRQQTPEALLEELLAFFQRKFYQGQPKKWAQDRRRLLQWVILWPAKWLDEKGVTLSPDRYRDLIYSVFQDSLRFGNTENITYLPAWLAKVIQSHFDHHGEEIYEEAKSLRNLVTDTLAVTGKLPIIRPDPIRDLAKAANLLKLRPHRKSIPKNPQQLGLSL